MDFLNDEDFLMEESKGRMFRHSLRVPYADVDSMGFVYYANYLVYFEMARSAFLREAGTPYGDLEKRGIWLPVVVSHCEYKKPAGFDDLLTVVSRCSEVRGTRLHVDYEVLKGDELIVTGFTEHVCMTPEGKVLRPVPEVKALTQAPAKETGV
jgi:acyl-CoA thioester hydrolase